MARKAGPSLDHATVIATAADLADAQGLEGMTLAALAGRLGIQTPSLYNYVTGLAGLRRELALVGLRELLDRLQRAAVGKAAGEALVAFAHAFRAFAHEHPGLYAATLRAPLADDPAWAATASELVGLVVDVLAGYGLEGEDALHATRGLRSLVHGFVALEALGGFGLPLDLDESYDRLVRLFGAGLCERRMDADTPWREE
jgi:AcrR family transcriptional regulator